MKKIKWTTDKDSSRATIGNITLFCYATLLKSPSWKAVVRMTSNPTYGTKYGRCCRKSLSAAQADALELAGELLEDLKISVEKEIKGLARHQRDI